MCVVVSRVQTLTALATAILGHCVAMFVLAWVLNNGAGVFDGAVFLIFFLFLASVVVVFTFWSAFVFLLLC